MQRARDISEGETVAEFPAEPLVNANLRGTGELDEQRRAPDGVGDDERHDLVIVEEFIGADVHYRRRGTVPILAVDVSRDLRREIRRVAVVARGRVAGDVVVTGDGVPESGIFTV